MTGEIEKLTRRLQREQKARAEAEHLLEKKAADLFEKNCELQNLSESLEKLVAQRTSQMQHARDEALTALQVKSHFIANMSHELRTPMNGVLGILSLLDEEPLSQSQRELVSIAQASGKHLLMVINDVLDFSKIEAAKIDLVEAPLGLREYVKGLCKAFELEASQKNIGFAYCVYDNVPDTLITDELRLTQIITNLLSNAIKFTKQGSVSLSFHSLDENHSGIPTYRITVSDTGIGISKENIHTVFSAFEQADTSITREFGGTGLGMSITKHLVDMFGGKISVESDFGKGTSFHVDIPMVAAERAAISSQATHPLNIKHDLSNVLLVEDNKINQLVAKRMLENWGLNVSIARDGQEAIDMLKRLPFDVILMDLQMPIKGGIQATLEIREQGIIDAHTPIIAMTAHSSQEHIDECFASGMQGHISKPIDKTILKRLLEQFVKPIEPELPISAPLPSNIISGLNLEDGLNRLNGDWTLLYFLLRSFFEEYARLQETLTVLMAKEDMAGALELMHRIKGSSGNLGLFELSELASQAEKKLKQHRKISAEEITHLHEMLEKVTSDFAALEPPIDADETANTREESTEYLLAKMDEILLYLSKDVFASEDNLKDLLRCALPNKTLGIVQEANYAMHKFDIQAVKHSITLARQSLV